MTKKKATKTSSSATPSRTAKALAFIRKIGRPVVGTTLILAITGGAAYGIITGVRSARHSGFVAGCKDAANGISDAFGLGFDPTSVATVCEDQAKKFENK